MIDYRAFAFPVTRGESTIQVFTLGRAPEASRVSVSNVQKSVWKCFVRKAPLDLGPSTFRKIISSNRDR